MARRCGPPKKVGRPAAPDHPDPQLASTHRCQSPANPAQASRSSVERSSPTAMMAQYSPPGCCRKAEPIRGPGSASRSGPIGGKDSRSPNPRSAHAIRRRMTWFSAGSGEVNPMANWVEVDEVRNFVMRVRIVRRWRRDATASHSPTDEFHRRQAGGRGRTGSRARLDPEPNCSRASKGRSASVTLSSQNAFWMQPLPRALATAAMIIPWSSDKLGVGDPPRLHVHRVEKAVRPVGLELVLQGSRRS